MKWDIKVNTEDLRFRTEVKGVIDSLINKSISKNFMGHDPYDFSNSDLKILKRQGTGVAAILSYLNKISIINFRSLLKIPETHNSKANAIFLSALTIYNHRSYNSEIETLYKWIINSQPGEFKPYFSAGFSFKISMSGYTSGPGKSSLIISLFTVYALIDLYRITKRSDILDHILSFESLIEERLPKVEDSQRLYYSYHFDRFDETYNATAKIGKFYALLYEHISQRSEYIIKIRKILNYLKEKQRADGSWPYSSMLSYSDSFHTAFILESINSMTLVYGEDLSHQEMLVKGFEDYKENFFSNGRPVHFHKKYNQTGGRSVIGVELRDCANAIIFFSDLKKSALATEIVYWTLENMLIDPNVVFYKNKFWTCKIDYIRWNAWLLYALVIYFNKFLK